MAVRILPSCSCQQTSCLGSSGPHFMPREFEMRPVWGAIPGSFRRKQLPVVFAVSPLMDSKPEAETSIRHRCGSMRPNASSVEEGKCHGVLVRTKRRSADQRSSSQFRPVKVCCERDDKNRLQQPNQRITRPDHDRPAAGLFAWPILAEVRPTRPRLVSNLVLCIEVSRPL